MDHRNALVLTLLLIVVILIISGCKHQEFPDIEECKQILFEEDGDVDCIE